MHDYRDRRVLGVADCMRLSDHPGQDVESWQSHRLVERVGELSDVLVNLLVLFLVRRKVNGDEGGGIEGSSRGRSRPDGS